MEFGTTELVDKSFCFVWYIKNFTKTYELKKSDLISPIFTGGQHNRHKWQLSIWSDEDEIETAKYIRMAVQLLQSDKGELDSDDVESETINAHVSFHLEAPAGELIHKLDAEYKFDADEDYAKWSDFMSEIDLMRRLSKQDTVKIMCRIWIKNEIYERVWRKDDVEIDYQDLHEIKQKRHSELSADFRKLLENPKFADISISTPKKTFKAHKNILSARSPVFYSMFETAMLESSQNTMEILDFEEHVVKAMLEYIYCGESKDLKEFPSDLLQIADKYDIKGLAADCELVLLENLDITNVTRLFALGDRCNAKSLKQKAIEFIQLNEEELKKTEEFLRFAKTNPSLVAELYLAK